MAGLIIYNLLNIINARSSLFSAPLWGASGPYTAHTVRFLVNAIFHLPKIIILAATFHPNSPISSASSLGFANISSTEAMARFNSFSVCFLFWDLHDDEMAVFSHVEVDMSDHAGSGEQCGSEFTTLSIVDTLVYNLLITREGYNTQDIALYF